MSRRPPFHAAVDSLSYRVPDGRTLFDNITLAFANERTGIVGANGSGKSTLARILVGAVAPTSGSVVRHGTVGWLPQEVTFPAEWTVADALGIAAPLGAVERLLAGEGNDGDADLAHDAWDIAARGQAALDDVGLGALGLRRSLGAVSGGEATRLALAALVLRAPDLLVLDEPTNHLDATARAHVHALVARWPRGLVVVSHDRDVLARVDRILELSGLGPRLYGGAYDDYRAQRDVEDEAARRELDGATLEVKRAARAAQEARERKQRRDARGKQSRAEGGMPKILLNKRRDQAESTVGRLSADAGRAMEERRARVDAARERVEQRATLAFSLPSSALHRRQRVLAMHDVRFAHAGSAHPIVDGFSLELFGPERVAIVGDNGSGKSTLLRLVAGELPAHHGTVSLGVAAERVALLGQRVAWPRADGTVIDNFTARNDAANEAYARQALAAFGFRGDAALRPVMALSGGEALRAALATLLHATIPPQLLLLDEPTNHLDLDSIEAVERALAAWDGAMLVVSHDRRFLDAIGVHRVLHLTGGALPPLTGRD